MQKTPPNCKVGLGEMFLVVCNLQGKQHLKPKLTCAVGYGYLKIINTVF